MSASEMPGATARRVAAPAVPRPWKASMMPMTVPKRPTKVAPLAMVASQVMRVSMAVRASEDAVWAARSRAAGLRGVPRPPLWRWYSSLISLKTETSGLGLKLPAMAAISERRPDLRKARRKPWLCLRARPKRCHLEIMMAQEQMLASEQDDEDGEGDGAGVAHHLHELAATGANRRKRGVILKEAEREGDGRGQWMQNH